MVNVNKQQQIQKQLSELRNWTKEKYIKKLILGFGVLIILSLFALFIFKPFSAYILKNYHTPGQSTVRDKRVLEKVGTENIYNQSLNMEYSFYPLPRNPSNTKKFLQKIAKDSIILQGGAQDGLISLDDTFYNAISIDYLKRIQMVSKVKNAILTNENKISGSVIAIFFYNNSPGKIGYDKGKSLAYSTITKLHTNVVNGTLTTEQAADEIKNNSDLANVDKEYKANAFLAFTVTPQQAITFDPSFDAAIKNLQPGQTTPIYTGQDKDRSTGKIIDVVYMFAQVKSVKTNGSNESFDDWYAQKQKEYEATIY